MPSPSVPSRDALAEANWDVVVCGGGLAGLLLSRQLRRTHPELSVAVLEKTTRPLTEAAHKVGESSVELGSRYLEDLGLKDYLLEHHIVKFGLRFFPGGGDKPLHERTEIGPPTEPIVPSYQMDRGVFESDLREMVVEEDGVALFEGVTVKDVELAQGDALHTVTVEVADGERVEAKARWVVDATGRAALLRRRMKLKRGTRHVASAGWYRVKGKVDLTELAPATAEAAEWHGHEFADQRWRSTNHMMGDGYWLWLIPLGSGNTSVGMVVHEDTHSFDDVRTLENTQAFIERVEPHIAKGLEGLEILDFMCIKGYSHNVARAWSADRWALVGEAGAFVDPLYSPGTDFIAFANRFTGEVIRCDLEGGDLDARARELNLQYRALVLGSVDVYKSSSPVFGHARAMLTKIYWDNFAYWNFPCQYFFQGIYKLSGEAHSAFSPVGKRFVELSGYMQQLLREWALMTPEQPEGKMLGMPQFPSIVIDSHLALDKPMSPEETLAYMEMRRGQAEEMAGEILLRIVQELGPERGAELLERIEFASWDLTIDPARLEVEDTIGLARRRALSKVARDVERSLGRARKHEDPAAARALLVTGAAA